MRAIKNKTWGLMSQAGTDWIELEDLIAVKLPNGFVLRMKYRFYSYLCWRLCMLVKKQ